MINSIETARSLIEKEYCIPGEIVLRIFTRPPFTLGDVPPFTLENIPGDAFLIITNKRLFYLTNSYCNVIVLRFISEVSVHYDYGSRNSSNFVTMRFPAGDTSGGGSSHSYDFLRKSDAEEAFKLIMKNLVS